MKKKIITKLKEISVRKKKYKTSNSCGNLKFLILYFVSSFFILYFCLFLND